MKSKLLILLKTSIINNFGINKIKQAPLNRKILYLLFAFFIVSNLLLTIVSYAEMLLDFLSKYNMEIMMLPLFALFAYFIAIIFNMYTAKSRLFDAKDNDLLLAMPIDSKIVLLSRVLQIFLVNLLVILFVFIPSIVVYVTRIDVNLSFYPIISFILLILPIIPTVLSCLIGYFIAFISSKTNAKNLVETVLPLLFAGLIFYFSGNASNLLLKIINNIDQYEQIIKFLFFPVYAINQILLSGKNIYLIFYALCNFIVLCLFIAILNKSYFKLISNLKKNNVKSNYQMKSLKTNSIKKSLLKKEIKKYFSSPIYISNTSFGIIAILLFSFVTLFKPELINKVFEMGVAIEPVYIVACLVVMIGALDNTASVSLSLEGNTLWILKSLPISVKNLFNAKIIFNLLVVVPITFISLVVMKFSLGYSFVDLGYLLFLLISSSVFASYFGLLVNLLFPKFEFNNDVEVVKQSMSCIVGIFVPMILGIIIIFIYSTLKINFYNYIVLVSCGFIVFAYIIKRIINSWGIKRFNSFEV